MLTRLRYWWARRLAFKAILTSLECYPETWKFLSATRAEKDGLVINAYRSYSSPFGHWNVDILANKEEVGLPFWLGRRFRRAMQRAVSYRVLRNAVAALKPQNTPLQIEQAERWPCVNGGTCRDEECKPL